MRRPQRGPATLPTARAHTGCCTGSWPGELTVPVLCSPWNRTCPAPSDRASPRHRACSHAAWLAPQSPASSTAGWAPCGCDAPGAARLVGQHGALQPAPCSAAQGDRENRAGGACTAPQPASPGAHRRPRGGTDPARRSPTHTAFVRGRPANRALDTAPGTQPAQQHLIPLSQKPVCSLTS